MAEVELYNAAIQPPCLFYANLNCAGFIKLVVQALSCLNLMDSNPIPPKCHNNAKSAVWNMEGVLTLNFSPSLGFEKI